MVAEERPDQGGLADPPSPPDQRDARTVGAHLREQRVQDAELGLAPDEHLLRPRPGTRVARWRGEPWTDRVDDLIVHPLAERRSRMRCPIIVGRNIPQLGRGAGSTQDFR